MEKKRSAQKIRTLKKIHATEDPYCYLDYSQSIPVKEMSKQKILARVFEEIFLSRRLEEVSRRLKKIKLEQAQNL